MKSDKIKVASVVVTFNRLEKLKRTLTTYEDQVIRPDYLIVINNASTDGTSEYLQQFQKKTPLNTVVVNSTENLGGSGGFYLGEKEALKTDANWIMIADDDLYIEKDYISGLIKEIQERTADDIAIICGAVEERGKYSSVHRTQSHFSLLQLGFHEPIKESVYKRNIFEPDYVSYLGILINRRVLKLAGLVNKNFFIWNDDTEHVYRIKKYGKIYCCPEYVCHHDVGKENFSLSWKNYYGYRNTLYFYKKHKKILFPMKVIAFFIRTLLAVFKGHTIEEIRLRFIALKDGCIGKLGKHSKYRPGWKPSI